MINYTLRNELQEEKQSFATCRLICHLGEQQNDVRKTSPTPCHATLTTQDKAAYTILIVICLLNWESPRGLFVTRKSNSLCSSNWIFNRNKTTIEIIDSNKFLSNRAKNDTVASTSNHLIWIHVLAFISAAIEELFFIFFEVLS